MNKISTIFLTLTCGWLVTACLPSEEPGGATAETILDQGTSEATQVSEPTATMTAAATPTLGATITTPTATATNADADVEAAATPTPGATIMKPTVSGANADADVEFVRAVEAADGTWKFEVTVRHPDTGWEDYADGWDVVTSQGVVLKRQPDDPFTRLLLHPHETEQPFTRNQAGLVIPEGVTQVVVRAHDIVDGFGGQEVTVDLTADSGPNFEVSRQ